ncbi:MAG: hypothetical protein ACXWUX_08265, partial [Allosphingosinicella sp.]
SAAAFARPGRVWVASRETDHHKMGGRKMALQGRHLATAAVALLSGLSLSGCATTDYVDEQIASVNARIDGIEQRLQQTDATAQAAGQAAQAAGAEAQGANQRIDALTGRVDALEQRLVARRPRN